MAGPLIHPFAMDAGAQKGVSYADLPVDLQQQATEIARKRAISEAMLGQAISPIQQQTVAQGRVVPIHPLQAIVQALSGGLAGRMQGQADQGSRQLTANYNQGLAQAVSDYDKRRTGVPGERDPQELEQGADQGSPPPYKVQPDPRGAIQAAIMSQYGPLREYAKVEHAAEALRDTERLKTHTVVPGGSITRDGVILGTAPGKPDARPDKSIPENWQALLPEGVKPGRSPGTYIGPDGDTVQVQYENGKAVNSHMVNPLPTNRNPDGSMNRPVHPVTITSPDDPNKTIVVDANNGNRKIGDGPKLTQLGTVDQKLVQAMPQAKLRTGTMNQNLDRLATAMQNLHDDKGLSNITGTVMGRTPNFTNTATGAQGTLNTIKSNIFQTALQSMREASKTGGAVGNVSDREGDKLERTIGALDQAQGTPKFKEELQKAIKQVNLSKELIETAFQEQFGSVMESQGDVRTRADEILKGKK